MPEDSGIFSFFDGFWDNASGLFDRTLDYFTTKEVLDYEVDKNNAQWEYQLATIPQSNVTPLGSSNLVGLGLLLIGGALAYKVFVK